MTRDKHTEYKEHEVNTATNTLIQIAEQNIEYV